MKWGGGLSLEAFVVAPWNFVSHIQLYNGYVHREKTFFHNDFACKTATLHAIYARVSAAMPVVCTVQWVFWVNSGPVQTFVPSLGVPWCGGHVLSYKRLKRLWTIHTPQHKSVPTMVRAKPRNIQTFTCMGPFLKFSVNFELWRLLGEKCDFSIMSVFHCPMVCIAYTRKVGVGFVRRNVARPRTSSFFESRANKAVGSWGREWERRRKDCGTRLRFSPDNKHNSLKTELVTFIHF